MWTQIVYHVALSALNIDINCIKPSSFQLFISAPLLPSVKSCFGVCIYRGWVYTYFEFRGFRRQTANRCDRLISPACSTTVGRLSTPACSRYAANCIRPCVEQKKPWLVTVCGSEMIYYCAVCSLCCLLSANRRLHFAAVDVHVPFPARRRSKRSSRYERFRIRTRSPCANKTCCLYEKRPSSIQEHDVCWQKSAPGPSFFMF